MSLDKLPFNWFDLVPVVVLLLGIWRGRKHGMSEELLPMAKWLIVAFGAAVAYDPIGRFFMSSTPFGLLSCYIAGYLTVVLLVFILFSLFKRALGGKLLGSDFFGRAEYYLGVAAAMVRFACMLLCALALLNARLYSAAEIRARQKYQDDVYGSNFFPGLQSLQDSVFARSLTGPLIQRHCEQFLIRPTPPGGGKIERPKLDIPGV
jgi:uncharacterized membrane protein required for colicin V production